jgi:hypothetical protein
MLLLVRYCCRKVFIVTAAVTMWYDLQTVAVTCGLLPTHISALHHILTTYEVV